jgi:hypothetical protein
MLFDAFSPVLRLITPRSVDSLDVTEWALAPRGESAELRALRLHYLAPHAGPGGYLNPDDIEILEVTHIGLRNPEMEWLDFSRGLAIRRYLATDEHQLRGLYRRWHEMMTEGRVQHLEDV